MLNTQPSSRTCTERSARTAALSWARDVRPCRATNTTPSAWAATTAASVTGSSGGVSMTTRSTDPTATASRSAMALEPSSSLGLGGIEPLGNTDSPDGPYGRTASASGTSPVSTSVRPVRESRPEPESDLRAAQISVDQHHPVARLGKADRKLAQMVDLPSSGIGLVTASTRAVPVASTKRRLVRSLRIASARMVATSAVLEVARLPRDRRAYAHCRRTGCRPAGAHRSDSAASPRRAPWCPGPPAIPNRRSPNTRPSRAAKGRSRAGRGDTGWGLTRGLRNTSTLTVEVSAFGGVSTRSTSSMNRGTMISSNRRARSGSESVSMAVSITVLGSTRPTNRDRISCATQAQSWPWPPPPRPVDRW